MIRPHTRRFHRRLSHLVGCFLLSLSLVVAPGIVTHIGTAEPTSAQKAAASGLTQLNQDESPLQHLSEKVLASKIVASGAASQRRYRPKRVSRPSGTTVGAPRRGDDFCGVEAMGTFTALAPVSHVGQTTAAHPTFAWFVPDAQPAPVKFTLYSAGTESPIFETEVPSQAGIVQFRLPLQQPGLQPGRYRWKIERICFPKRLEAEVEFEVVKPPANLEEHWYDALAEALKNSDDPSAKEQVRSLLNDLQAIEAEAAAQTPDPKATAVLTKQSDSLKQIIDLEQKRSPSQPR